MTFTNFSHHLFRGSLIASIIVTQSTIVSALEATQINNIAKNITVRIDIGDGSDHGSGVIIAQENSNYYVLTSKHVVKYLDYEYSIVTPEGNKYYLNNSNIKHIEGVDLAVISFTSDRQYKVALLESSPSRIIPGIPVYVNGFPKAGREIKSGAQFTSGSLTGLNQNHNSGYDLVYNNFTRGGMSGGPVLNAQGKLIGIHGLAEQERVEAATNDCKIPGSESSVLPPPIGSLENESNCALEVKTPEKIDLNLGISITTFVKRAASIGMERLIDSTTVNIPTRTPRISPSDS